MCHGSRFSKSRWCCTREIQIRLRGLSHFVFNGAAKEASFEASHAIGATARFEGWRCGCKLIVLVLSLVVG